MRTVLEITKSEDVLIESIIKNFPYHLKDKIETFYIKTYCDVTNYEICLSESSPSVDVSDLKRDICKIIKKHEKSAEYNIDFYLSLPF